MAVHCRRAPSLVDVTNMGTLAGKCKYQDKSLRRWGLQKWEQLTTCHSDVSNDQLLEVDSVAGGSPRRAAHAEPTGPRGGRRQTHRSIVTRVVRTMGFRLRSCPDGTTALAFSREHARDRALDDAAWEKHRLDLEYEQKLRERRD